MYNLYQCYQGCTTTIINISMDVQLLSMLLGFTSFINIIRVCNFYQYYQRSSTNIINVIMGIQHLSMLSGVYNIYQTQTQFKFKRNLFNPFYIYNINVIKSIQPLSMLLWCTTLSMVLGVYILYQYYQGCTNFINVVRVYNNPSQC